MGRRERDPNRISLLIRNLPLDVRAEDVKDRFEKYGEIRDVYLPKDYYTGRPRGFGFIEFRDPRDAEEALYHLDRTTFMGREITVVMSKESRKTPRDMIQRERGPRGYDSRGGDRDRDRGGRDRDRDYRDSYRDRDSGRGYGRDRSRSPARRYSRSRSPRGERSGRGRGRSYSRSRSPAPPRDNRRSRSRSRSPVRRDTPPARYDDEPRRSRSRSPRRDRSRSPAEAAGGGGGRRSNSPGRSAGGADDDYEEHGAASPPRDARMDSPPRSGGYDD